MADEPENLTIRLLQEMRGDVQNLRGDMQSLRGEVQELREDLTNRIDGNTLILNMLAGMLHEHEHRLRAVEER